MAFERSLRPLFLDLSLLRLSDLPGTFLDTVSDRHLGLVISLFTELFLMFAKLEASEMAMVQTFHDYGHVLVLLYEGVVFTVCLYTHFHVLPCPVDICQIGY